MGEIARLKIAPQKHEAVVSIKDHKFDVNKLADYTLFLQISDHDFSAVAMDLDESRCVQVDQWKLFDIHSSTQLKQQLEMIYDEHHNLQAGFWGDIRLSFKNVHFSLIPSSLFDAEDIPHYLSLNCYFNGDKEDVGYFKHNKLDLVNTYSFDMELVTWIKEKYPTKEVITRHQTTAFIEGVTKYNQVAEGHAMFIYCDDVNVNIVILQNNQLKYCNLFEYKSPEDLTYYTMFVIHELGLNPETLPVTLWGNIDQTSIHFTRLYKFVRYLALGKRPEGIHFGYKFDEIYDHQFFDLYNMYLCE